MICWVVLHTVVQSCARLNNVSVLYWAVLALQCSDLWSSILLNSAVRRSVACYSADLFRTVLSWTAQSSVLQYSCNNVWKFSVFYSAVLSSVSQYSASMCVVLQCCKVVNKFRGEPTSLKNRKKKCLFPPFQTNWSYTSVAEVINLFITILSTGVSSGSRTRTLNHGVMKKVFYHLVITGHQDYKTFQF